MIDFAHIGLPKSASTFLQKAVFPSHPDIVSIGGGKIKHSIEGRPIEDLWLSEPGDYDVDEARRGFQRLISLHETHGKVVGLSEECWSGHGITGHNALLAPERIREVFGPIKILLILRHPVTYIYSQYNQFIKQGGAVTLRSLLNDETFWLERNIVRKYEYRKLVARVHDLFGAGNTLLLPVEYLRDDVQGFCDRIFDFLGVRQIQVQNVVVNRSISRPALSILRFLNYLDIPRSRMGKEWISRRLDYYLFNRLPLKSRNPSFGELLQLQPLLGEVLNEEAYHFWSDDLEHYNYSFRD